MTAVPHNYKPSRLPRRDLTAAASAARAALDDCVDQLVESGRREDVLRDGAAANLQQVEQTYPGLRGKR